MPGAGRAHDAGKGPRAGASSPSRTTAAAQRGDGAGTGSQLALRGAGTGRSLCAEDMQYLEENERRNAEVYEGWRQRKEDQGYKTREQKER